MIPEIFKKENFEVRAMLIEGEPHFVAKDVCDALGASNVSQALSRLDDDEKGITLNDTPSGKQEMLIVNESGLYSLVLSSRKPEAKQFKKWITAEVLPAIRKHGAYMTAETIEKALLNPDTIIQIAMNLKDEQQKRRALEEKIEADKPLVSFAKTIEASVDAILVGNYAKLLSEAEGVKIGQNNLMAWLRDEGYLISGGQRHNVPKQKYIDNGWFDFTTSTFAGSTGAHQRFTPKITGKGQIALAKKIVEAFKPTTKSA